MDRGFGPGGLGESPGEVLEIRAKAYFREVKAVQAPYLAGSSS